jgi:hypothetical protein
MVLLMSATANTLLSVCIGIIIGAVGMAAWYGSHRDSRDQEREFDERDIYQNPKIKKFISK